MNILKLNIFHDTLPYKKRVACIGFFDALHQGHQTLIKECLKYDGVKTFITFSFSEKLIIPKANNEYLFNETQKINYISKLGIEDYIEIIFDENVKNMTPLQFEETLIKLGVETLICGFDFKYGCHRQGDITTLSNNKNFNVVVIPEIALHNEKISSTSIKEYLSKGDICRVNQLLGRFYRIQSKVVEGKKLGRKIGYPTANLEKDLQYVLPKVGVYYGNVIIDEKSYAAMISVGYNPTVELLQSPVIEAHILDFNENIYYKTVEVEFIDRIRDEIKFNSLEALIEQLKSDELWVRKHLKD